MNVHKNARLTPRGRERLVELAQSGQTPQAIAKAAGVCRCTMAILSMLVAQAHVEGMRLLARDRRLKSYSSFVLYVQEGSACRKSM